MADQANYVPGCGTQQTYPTVVVRQEDINCPSACPTPNRIAPDVQYFTANDDCTIDLSVASNSSNRIMIFGAGAWDSTNAAFVLANFGGKLPSGFELIVNGSADPNAARIDWLNRLFTADTYVFNRIIIQNITGATAQNQFNQKLYTSNFTFDPDDACPGKINGRSCSPCDDGNYAEQVYDSCQSVAGLHNIIFIPVVAGVSFDVQLCVAKAGIGRNFVECATACGATQVSAQTRFNANF